MTTDFRPRDVLWVLAPEADSAVVADDLLEIRTLATEVAAAAAAAENVYVEMAVAKVEVTVLTAEKLVYLPETKLDWKTSEVQTGGKGVLASYKGMETVAITK
nr:hypothetical protein BaRGS_014046 [Batillaria attramentaria]